MLDGLDLTQIEVGAELERGFTVVGKRRSREIARLAQELWIRHQHQQPAQQISAETLNEYINYIEPLCQDYYTELAIDLLAEAIASTTAASIVEAFIDRIETRWQFKFKPEGGGVSKVAAFVQRQQQHGNWDDESKIHESLRLKK